jgi:hypothetical protein
VCRELHKLTCTNHTVSNRVSFYIFQPPCSPLPRAIFLFPFPAFPFPFLLPRVRFSFYICTPYLLPE